MKLADRIVLLNNLPDKGSSVSLAIRMDIFDKVKLTQDEIKKFKMEETKAGITFSKEAAAKDFDIDFTKAETDYVAKHLKELDKTEQLTGQTYALFKLFC